MRNKRVILKGGFGNQLFQWGFAHYICSLGYKTSLIGYETRTTTSSSQPASAQFSLIRGLMEGCNCIEFKTYSLSLPIYRGIRDVQTVRHPLKKMPGFYQSFNNNAFQLITTREIARNRNFSGYFQNYGFIKEVESILISELQNYFKRYGANNKLNESEFLNVMHIRRGDFATLSHFSIVGILSSSYYQRATNLLDMRSWTALTDDPHNILDVTSRIQIDHVLGPAVLDTVGALSAMANARNLIISNSTLAWWGGLLSIHQGGCVLAPTPWVKEDKLDLSLGIMHDEFQKVPAEFLENLAEYELAHMSDPSQPK